MCMIRELVGICMEVPLISVIVLFIELCICVRYFLGGGQWLPIVSTVGRLCVGVLVMKYIQPSQHFARSSLAFLYEKLKQG